MTSFHSFANHVSGLSAQTVKAGTHTFGPGVTRIRKWNVASIPPKSSVSDPFTFSTCRSNPDSSFASLMNNRKRPLSIEFDDFVVRNSFGSQGINDLNEVISQDKLWFNPEQVRQSCESQTANELEESLKAACENHQAIGSEEREQDQRGTRPDVITSGAKDFIHIPSIAGDSK